MNDQTTITIEPETKTSTALATIKTSMPTILAADDKDILGKLRAELDGFVPDVSSKKGREEIASKAFKPRKAKAEFKRLADSLKEDAQKTIKLTNAEFKVLEEKLDQLSDEIRRPLDEIEALEAARAGANETAIGTLEALVNGLTDLSPAEIKERHRQAGIVAEFEWSPEFIARAERIQNGVLAQMEVAYTRAVQREAEAAAEVVRLAEEAERQRLAAIEAQRLREEQIACEAAEAARVAAEAKALREAEEAAAAVRRAQEEAAAKARAETDAAARREQEALAAVERAKRAAEQAEADLLASIERERIAAERAEINRLAEIARAEREKAEAVEAERRRMEAARATEEAERARQVEADRVVAENRAANRAHQAKINGEALIAIMLAMSDVHPGTEEDARKIGVEIIKAIAMGKIPHVTIGY